VVIGFLRELLALHLRLVDEVEREFASEDRRQRKSPS
jgi:hypothetical protein